MSYSDECGKSGILKTLLITVRMQYGRTWVTSRGVSVDGRVTGCSRLPPAASRVRITGIPKLPSFSDVEFTKL